MVESVSAAEFALLRALGDGETLSAACDGGAVRALHRSFDVSTCLQRRVADATLCDFSLGS